MINDILTLLSERSDFFIKLFHRTFDDFYYFYNNCDCFGWYNWYYCK